MAENKEEMCNDLETAATLLKIMSSNPTTTSKTAVPQSSPHYLTIPAQSGTVEESKKTQCPAESKEKPTLMNHPRPTKPKSAVPNPLTTSTQGQFQPQAQQGPSSRVSSTNNKNEIPQKPPSFFAAPPFIASGNSNYIMPTPSTFSFLQTMLAHQQQQASCLGSSSSGVPTPNPVLLPNPLTRCNTNPTTKEQQQQQADIRRDEVEKALNSKPQRGRKRRNLNDEERQELTRTRNREHAKSTRERKKQRHLELLDMEQHYKLLRNQHDLQTQRRHAVRRFLQVRQAMLQQTTQDDTAAIDALIVRNNFKYHIRGQRGGAELDGVTLMNLFDKSFAALLPVPDMQGVSYRYDAIAMTEQGDAVVECSICLGSTRCFKTLHMTIAFAEESTKIVSVNVAFIQEEADRAPSLRNQISHPSVVSLDDRFAFGRCKTDDEDTMA